jgi:hypothetical protein
VSTWLREESDPTLAGVDIICDRMAFAARALPVVAKLRDQFIVLATQLNQAQKNAKQAFERERAAHARPAAAAPPPKRPATTAASGSSPLRARCLKAWDKAK